MTERIRLKLPAVRRAVQDMPWAIVPEKLEAMMEALAVHAQGGRFTAAELESRIGARGGDSKPVPTKSGGILVLPLYGVIAHRMDLFTEFSGGTSTQRFADQFDAAMADPNIAAIVLDCDSPGGAVDGTPELAKRIFDARGQGKKLIAISNTMTASAAYWIASACDEVVASPSAVVGSIGVFMVHLDESGMDEQMGLRYTMISAGKYKTEANPYQPLSDDARAALQAQVEEYYGMFVGAVAKHRGVSVKDVRSGFGEGRVLTSKQALAAGMIDRIDTLDGVLTKLGARNISPSGRIRQASAREAALEHARATAESRELGALPFVAGVAVQDGASSEESPTEQEACPDCGAPLEDGTCPTCDAALPADTPAANANTTLLAADRAAVTQLHAPVTTTAPKANKETSMPGDNGTAAHNGAVDINTALAADRQRASSIRAIGREHNIAEARVEQLVNDGASVETASAAFLTDIRQARQANPAIRVGADREAERPFASVGEQLVAVVRASIPGGSTDPRLLALNARANRMLAGTPSGMNESVGSEGGFFIQPELLPGIMDPVYQEDPILSRVFRIPSSAPGVKYYVVDETSRVTGSRWGGIQMYRGAEADTVTAKKPAMRIMELNKKKLIGIAYLTEELQIDAPAASALLSRAFQTELQFTLADEIFRGLGAGQMLGFLKSGAFVSQAIEATQTIANTNTFIALNTSKMLSRIPPSLWNQMIWLYNQELLPSLVTAVVGAGGSSVPVFLGAGGISGKPYDTIWGRPAFASELCEAVGTPGDLVAVVPSEYHMLTDDGAVQATSIHVRFLYGENVLRITHRSDGQPVWKQAITPYKGALSRSPFVGLAVRA